MKTNCHKLRNIVLIVSGYDVECWADHTIYVIDDVRCGAEDIEVRLNLKKSICCYNNYKILFVKATHSFICLNLSLKVSLVLNKQLVKYRLTIQTTILRNAWKLTCTLLVDRCAVIVHFVICVGEGNTRNGSNSNL